MSDAANRRQARRAPLVSRVTSPAPIAAALLAVFAVSACHVHSLTSCRERILRYLQSGTEAQYKASEDCWYYLVCQGVAALPEACRIYRETGVGSWINDFLGTLGLIEERKGSELFDLIAVAREMDPDAGLAAHAVLKVRMDAMESFLIWNPALVYEAHFGEGTWPADIPVESFGRFEE